MSVRINYKGGYLHCNVNGNVSEYADFFDSCEECLDEILDEVEEDCVENGYDEIKIEAVKSYYRIKIGNWPGEWGCKK
jgi:hypothetical protein